MDKFVFFDIDDTLVKTGEFNKAAVSHTLEILDQSNISISLEDRLNIYLQIYPENKSNLDLFIVYFKELFNSYKDKFENYRQAIELGELAKKRYEDYREEHFRDFMPESTIEVLKKLRSRGFELGIISQGDIDYQKRKFECLHLEKLINPNWAFYTKKKSVEFYRDVKNRVVESYGDVEILMVGDREDNDVLMAREAGFSVIRIVGNTKYKDKNFSNYLEFKSFKDYYKYLLSKS